MNQLPTPDLEQPRFPALVCTLDLETSGPNAINPDRANLAVVGLKVYTWDEQQEGYQSGPYEHYAPADFSALQQRLDELSGPIVGHNIFNFDYRILRRHLNLEHIVEKSADTLHLLYEMGGGGEEGGLYSLDQLAKENFGEGKKIKASTIPQLLKDGKLAEVLAYNERDCDLTFRLWWKMVSERHVSTGEMIYDGVDEGFPPEEAIYELEDEEVNVLTCATPRFTYTAWVEQLERDGWIIMPPQERRRREKEREQQRKKAGEAVSKRSREMREFIEQQFQDDLPRKFAQPTRGNIPASPDVVGEEAWALLGRAGLSGNTWAEEVVCRLILGEHVRPARLELPGRPDDPEGRAELMKSILAALIADGYIPHYYANQDGPDDDAISLDGPPPTLAEQYVERIRERYFELSALFGESETGFEIVRWASGVHPTYTNAMNALRGDGHLVFEDGSYVFDGDTVISIFQLKPKMLTDEEVAALEAYIRDHP